MPNISIRMTESDEENLDSLVIAVRAYYEHMGKTLPVAARMAAEVTRSSALRDLLLAWKRGEANELFHCGLTAPIRDGG